MESWALTTSSKLPFGCCVKLSGRTKVFIIGLTLIESQEEIDLGIRQ